MMVMTTLDMYKIIPIP